MRTPDPPNLGVLTNSIVQASKEVAAEAFHASITVTK